MKKLALVCIVIVNGFALMQDCGWKMRELEKAVDEFKKCEKSADKDKKCEVLMQKIQTLAKKHQICISEQYDDLRTKIEQ